MTLSASAQAYKESMVQKMGAFARQKATLLSNTMMDGNNAEAKVATKATKVARAAAKDGIYGSYIMSMTDYQSEPQGCDSVVIERVNVTGEDGTVYNTKITMPAQGYSEDEEKYYDTSYTFYGVYDEKKGTITCPAQASIEHFEYGEIDVLRWTGSLDDLDNVTPDEEPFTFTVNEDGSIFLDDCGLWFYMADYAEAHPGETVTWNNWFNVELRPINGEMNFEALTRDASGNRYYKPCNPAGVAIDDFLYSANIYGFAPYGVVYDTSANGFGLSGIVSVNFDGNGNAELPSKQNVWSARTLLSDAETLAKAGDYFYTQGPDAERYASADVNATGTVTGNTLNFDYVAVYTNSWEENDGTQTYQAAIGTWLHNIKITKGDAFLTGIEDVNVSNVNAIKNAKFYNVLGQRVAANTKGLVIANGKKFYNK